MEKAAGIIEFLETTCVVVRDGRLATLDLPVLIEQHNRFGAAVDGRGQLIWRLRCCSAR
jgi:hypothetical protein